MDKNFIVTSEVIITAKDENEAMKRVYNSDIELGLDMLRNAEILEKEE